MTILSQWWWRYRWTLLFTLLSLGLGSLVGVGAGIALSLRAPHGSRPEFYIELYFAAIVGTILVAVLLTRARAGLPFLLGVIAFLPSRTGMQWQGPVVLTAVDAVVLLGGIVLFLTTKVVRKERLQPLVVRTPLWLWVLFGVLGMIVAVARGVPWNNYVIEIKGFYLYILIAVLCVNVVRTRLTLWLVALTTVLAAAPNVIFQLRDTASGTAAMTMTLANGAVVGRTSGGSGAINQYACYLMLVFFLTLGMGMAARRWYVRLFFYLCAAYFLVGIGLTYTRGAWLATIIGLVVMGLAGGWRVLGGLTVTASIGYFLIPSWIWARLNFQDNSVAERVGYANTALATIRAYPFLGGGWGSNFYLVGKYVGSINLPGDLPFWHNDYLIVGTQVGVPGLLVFVWIWISLGIVGLRTYRRAPRGMLRSCLLGMLAGLAAMLTQSATEMLVWNYQTGPMLWLFVGLICATINLLHEEARQVAPALPADPARRPVVAA